MKVRYQLARRKAADLIEELGIKKAPIPLDRIAKHLRISIRSEPFSGELSGMVHVSKSGTAIIGVNQLHTEKRRRFTVAHEIGHFLLHSENDFHLDSKSVIAFRDQNSSLATNSREIEANQFAAALLMPERFLLRDLASDSYESLETETAISRLAAKYNVSEQAMTIRLSSLKLLI